MAWATIDLRPREPEVHVAPDPDVFGHELTKDCWCKPKVKPEPGADVVVHQESEA